MLNNPCLHYSTYFVQFSGDDALKTFTIAKEEKVCKSIFVPWFLMLFTGWRCHSGFSDASERRAGPIYYYFCLPVALRGWLVLGKELLFVSQRALEKKKTEVIKRENNFSTFLSSSSLTIYCRENQTRFLPPHVAKNSSWSWLPVSRKTSAEVRLLEQFKRVPTTATTRKLMRKYLEFCWALPFYGWEQKTYFIFPFLDWFIWFI